MRGARDRCEPASDTRVSTYTYTRTSTEPPDTCAAHRRYVIDVWHGLFLHVLAVIALGAGETEQTLLQDGVSLVPHGEREAQAALWSMHSIDGVTAGADVPLSVIPRIPSSPHLGGCVLATNRQQVRAARTDRRATAHGRAGRTTTRSRPPSSPRAPCPIAAPTRTDPTCPPERQWRCA